MSEFCRSHAYYDCPVCKGEDVVWVIPIVDRDGVQTGEMRIPEAGEPEVVGVLHVPWQETSVFQPVEAPAPRRKRAPVLQERASRSDAARPVTLDRPDPVLGARLAADFLLAEPRYQEAIARGRKVHEDALELSSKRGISYAEAIRLVTE